MPSRAGLPRRRQLLKALGAAWLSWTPPSRAQTRMSPLEERLAQWESFGWHWSGSSADRATAEWLAHTASGSGLTAELQTYPQRQVNVATCTVDDGHHQVVGLPLFNHDGTRGDGVRGKLFIPPAEGDILLLELPPQAHIEQALHEALSSVKPGRAVQAAVVVTTGAQEGLAPLDTVLATDKLPVVEVSSEAQPWLLDAARTGTLVHVVAQVEVVDGTAQNVIAGRLGRDPKLPPIVVCCATSAWGPATGERGGGIATWLQMASVVGAEQPQRSVILVGLSGEEVGGAGRAAFVKRFHDIASEASAWLELGPAIGARGSILQLQGEKSAWQSLIGRRLTEANVRFEARDVVTLPVPESIKTRVALRGTTVPALHMPTDFMPAAVDLPALGAIGAACARALLEYGQS